MAIETDIFILSNTRVSPEADSEWLNDLRRHLIQVMNQLIREPLKIDISTELEASGQLLTADYLDKVGATLVVQDKAWLGDNEYSTSLMNVDKYYRGKPNLFKVMRSHVPPSKQPGALGNRVNFDIEFLPGQEPVDEFWMKLVDLSYEVAKTIRKESFVKATNKETKAAVFLAENGDDNYVIRDMIRRELVRHNYRVLPDFQVSHDTPNLKDKIYDNLHQCDMVIHIIGENFGKPTEYGQSIEELQNDICASFCENENPALTRLIWFSPDISLLPEDQAIYIERFKRDAKALIGAELVQTPIEKLKNIIKRRLIQIAEQSLENEEDKGKKKIYLINDVEDVSSGDQIAEILSKNGFVVLRASYENDELALLKEHRKYLSLCDATLIFYGSNNERWIKMKMLDLLKAPGYGRTKPLLAKGVFVQDGELKVVPHGNLQDLTLMDKGSDISLEALGPFLNKLNEDA